MRGLFLAAILATPLAACAHLQTANTDADCRHVLSADGEPLRFCETADRVTVDDKPVETEGPAETRLIDDPKFLAAMMAQLPKSPRRSRSAARICKGDRPGYITIAASDLEAMLHSKSSAAKFDIAKGDAAAASDSIDLHADVSAPPGR